MRRTVQLDSALVKKLMQRSELLCHQDDDHDATARANISFQAKPCMHFGVCVCQTPKHQDTLHFWTNLARIFRQIFWKKKKEKKCSEARKLLDDYAIFLEFSALTEETALVQQPAMDVKDDWDALVLEEFSTCNLDINDDPPGPSSYHFHIAYMNFKTYHFGLWQLQHCQQDDLHDTGDTDIKLLSWVRPGFEFEEQQQDILTDLEAIAKLNFKQQWKVSIQTFALGSHLFDVDCASLAVTPVSSVNEFVVWKGSEEESKRRRVVANQSRSKNKTTQDRRGRGKRKASKKQGNGPKRRKTRQQNDDPELALLDELVDEHRRDSGSDSDPQVVVAADDDNYDCDNADPYGAEEEESEDNVGEENEKKQLQEILEDGVSLPSEHSIKESDSDIDLEAAEDQLLEQKHETKQQQQQQEDTKDVPAVAVESVEAVEAVEAVEDHRRGPQSGRASSTRSVLNREAIDIPGLGQLRYYKNSGNISAACTIHSADCRRSATTISQNKSGRPIGLLVAWLQLGHDYSARTSHVHSCKPSLTERQAAREFFNSLEGSSEFSQYERPKKSDEPDEPVKV